MLYVGKGMVVVPNSATVVNVKEGWLYATADATVNVTFQDETTFVAFPLAKGVVLPVGIKSASNASLANTVFVIKPRG